MLRTIAGGIPLQQLLDRGEIGRLAGEEMLRRERLQVIRRVGQLHGVPLFRLEIDHDLVQEEVPLRHPAEAPAFVQAIGAGLEFLELFRLSGVSFPDSTSFSQFRIHSERRSYGGGKQRQRNLLLMAGSFERAGDAEEQAKSAASLRKVPVPRCGREASVGRWALCRFGFGSPFMSACSLCWRSTWSASIARRTSLASRRRPSGASSGSRSPSLSICSSGSLKGAGGGARFLHRLRHRVLAQRRQHLRLRPHLHLLPGAAEVSASGACSGESWARSSCAAS